MDYTAGCELPQLQQELQIGRPTNRTPGGCTRFDDEQLILGIKSRYIIGRRPGKRVKSCLPGGP